MKLILYAATNFDAEAVFNASVEYNSVIKDINNDDGVGAAQTDYRLAAVGSGVSWRPSGVQTKKTIWVTKNGMDSNSGLLEGWCKSNNRRSSSDSSRRRYY